MSIRTFIGVEVGPLDELVKFEREINDLRVDAKLVEPENIHMTLKFLGDTEEDQIPEIIKIITKSINNIKPFTIKIKEAGVFPNLNYIKVIWVGIIDPGPMPEIAKKLNSQLKSLGFRSEKRGFKPHITLGRVKTRKNKDQLKRLIINNKDRIFGEININSVKLIKSVLDSKGPTYYTLDEIFFNNE
jgi:2'-5' RNA ligase